MSNRGKEKKTTMFLLPRDYQGSHLDTALSQFPPVHACEIPALFPLLFPNFPQGDGLRPSPAA